MSSVVRILRALALVASLAALGSTLGGCLISSNSKEDLQGSYVSDATYSQIQPGVTTKAWIEGTLGEPTKKTTLEDGSELWKWSYSKTKSSSGAVLFIFGGSSSSSTAGSAYVQMKDGVVTKTWRAE